MIQYINQTCPSKNSFIKTLFINIRDELEYRYHQIKKPWIYYQIRNTIFKHHQYHKTVPLRLEVGKYYDPDVRIVACIFEELQQFYKLSNCIIPEEIDNDLEPALKFWKENREQILLSGSSYFDHPELEHHLMNIIKHLNFLWY